MGAGTPQVPRRRIDGSCRAGRLSLKGTDQEFRERHADTGSPACARRSDAAVPVRLNVLRLEHELQTVVNGGMAPPQLPWVLTISATPLRLRTSPPGTRAAR
jgi:hypothetical protein